MTEIILTTEQAKMEALKQESIAIAQQCSQLSVTDESSLAIATQSLSKLNEKIKNIDKVRTDLKAPYFQAGKQIDALAKELSSPLEKVYDEGKKKIIAYNVEKQKAAEAEQRRLFALKQSLEKYATETIKQIDDSPDTESLTAVYESTVKNFPSTWVELQAEAEAIRLKLKDYASQRKIVLKTPQQADETAQDVIKEQIIAEVEVAGTSQIMDAAPEKAKGMKKDFDFEVADLALVPLEFLMVDEKKVNTWIKANSDSLSDGILFNGLRFKEKYSLTIR